MARPTTTTPTPTTTPTTKPARAASCRERLALYGAEALGDAEILAVIMGSGGSLTKAAALLESGGGLAGLASGDYTAPDGTRATLDAAIELGRRLARVEIPWTTALRGPDDVARYARATWGSESQETFNVIGMDARARVRLVRTVARGSVAHVDVHPREVFRPIIRAGLHSVIAVHNHPSGEPDPSQADIELTRRLADVGRLVGIPLLDHLVVTRTRSVSMASLGMVPGA